MVKLLYGIIGIILSQSVVNINGQAVDPSFCRNQGHSSGAFPHPDPSLCGYYVICAVFIPILLECPPDRIFIPHLGTNPPDGECELGYQETCQLLTTTTEGPNYTTTELEDSTLTIDYTIVSETTVDSATNEPITTVKISTTTPKNLPADICDSIEIIGFVPHPDNCVQYILCIFGSPTVLDCEAGHIFIPGLDRCEEGDPETCEMLTPPITHKTTTSTTAPIHRCPPGGFGYIPHLTNCTRYFQCIAGIRHLRFCHEGLLFDSVTLRCTLPELAVCAGAN